MTSRQHCIQQPTLDWVDKHFPSIFSEVHFGNHWALEGKSKAKSEICRCAREPRLQPRAPHTIILCSPACVSIGMSNVTRKPSCNSFVMGFDGGNATQYASLNSGEWDCSSHCRVGNLSYIFSPSGHREIGATVLIDDNPRYAVECASAGIDVLLYDWNMSYPWSKTPDG